MKRKLFLLTISLFSFLGNLQAQNAESAIASSQLETSSLEAAGAESEISEETPDTKKQKTPRVKKERPPKKPRASKKNSEGTADNSEASENAESLSGENSPVLEQNALNAESAIASSQSEMTSLEAAVGAESEITEETPDAKKQKTPRVKKERPSKKPRTSKKNSEDAAENSEAGENAESLSGETSPVLEQNALNAESAIAASQSEMNSLEAAGTDLENDSEEMPSAKKQKTPRVKKERLKKPRTSKKNSDNAAENSEAGEDAESLSGEISPILEQNAQNAESAIVSSRSEMTSLEAAGTDLENDSEETPRAKKKSRGESQDDPEHWPTIEELTANQYHFGILQNWGLSAASVTRIQKKSDMSNFVWNDRMIGIFYEAKSHDFIRFGEHTELNVIARMAIYYPYSYTFRDVKQIANQIILYAFDWFVAPSFSISFADRIIFDTQLGLHIMYQLHDMWEYFNLGAGLKLNVEFPISSRWTAIAGGMFSFENSNFGSNKNMRPFDYVWEYQVQLGVRYSKKYLNRHSYIKYKPKPLKTKRVRKISPLSEEMDLELDVEIETPEEDANVEIETSVENLPSAQYLPNFQR